MLRKFKISVDGTQYLVEMEEVGAPHPDAWPTPAPAASAAPEPAPAPAAAPGPHAGRPAPAAVLGSRGGGLPCPDRARCPAPSSTST
ncbi:MAG: hypothetical protein ACLTSX_08035 [Collinsella sp.]